MTGEDARGAAGDLGEAVPLRHRRRATPPAACATARDRRRLAAARTTRAGGWRPEPAHPVDLLHDVPEHLARRAQRCQLEDAGAGLAQGGTDAEQLVLGRERARHQLAVDRSVPHGAGGGEPESAGPDSLEHDGTHRLDVLGGRGLVAGAPFTHDVGPHGRVRHLGAHVHGPAPPLERVEILGEGLPLPLDPLGQCRAGNVLDPLHEADQPVVAVGLGRRETDSAIADHECRHAVPGRRRELGVPGGLAVVVGVDIDPPRVTSRPSASMIRVAPPWTVPTSVMRPESTATSAAVAAAPVPSTSVPP